MVMVTVMVLMMVMVIEPGGQAWWSSQHTRNQEEGKQRSSGQVRFSLLSNHMILLMTNVLAAVIKTNIIHSFKNFHLCSWVALDEGFVILFWSQSPYWSLFWIQHLGVVQCWCKYFCRTEKSSSFSCQLEVRLVFCFSLVRGELQYQAMETGQHLSPNDNNSEHFKVGSQKGFGREQRNAKLYGTQCVSNWLEALQCNNLHDTEYCVAIVCRALVWG